MLWARMVAYVTGTVNQELHREDKKGRRPRLVTWPRTPFRPKRAKRRRWAPLRPRPRRPIHEVQGWGIFDRYNGEFSTGIDSFRSSCLVDRVPAPIRRENFVSGGPFRKRPRV